MSHLLTLFWSFLQVGAFSVGGGYAAMPLIENQVCHLHTWLSAEEFAHLVTIAEMTPGPIAINAATFVGTRIAGLPGAVIATLGCILPSCLIVSLLSWLYRKYPDAVRTGSPAPGGSGTHRRCRPFSAENRPVFRRAHPTGAGLAAGCVVSCRLLSPPAEKAQSHPHDVWLRLDLSAVPSALTKNAGFPAFFLI